MTDSKIYEDIALRTGGDIYVGVVGPVRTGKSTFIKRFMETVVIPNIDNIYLKERARDELPQSGSGKTVMTAEPKFVPEDAVEISIGDDTLMSVRLIDCVGYMIPGAAGQMEDGEERMVATPWFDHEISMTEAAEEGTRRVIRDHSTIGLVITTDGSICGIPRENYVAAEEQVISELRQIGKPYLLLLNSTEPNSDRAQNLRSQLSEKYGVSCLCVNCLTIRAEDIEQIIDKLLCEFTTEEFCVYIPEWVEALPYGHSIKQELFREIASASTEVRKLKDAQSLAQRLNAIENVSDANISEMMLGKGSFSLKIDLPRELYYRTLSEESGLQIQNDGDLIALLCELSKTKFKFDKISAALNDVNEKGYGVVMPSLDEMVLQEPEIVRQGGKYKVVLRAGAPAIHMMKTNVETEVSPAVGGETASEEILGFLLQNFEGDATKIWESNIFGKSMYDIAGEGLNTKLKRMPEETGLKLRNALQRIINEGSGGLICIIL
ncbi:MAG: stage IV sporulation protein A [Oscillospiraceae bacterium]|nr:stage IV sporulation protein A [Oscillospiraceae bacterium]